jgi:hypothetical protein
MITPDLKTPWPVLTPDSIEGFHSKFLSRAAHSDVSMLIDPSTGDICKTTPFPKLNMLMYAHVIACLPANSTFHEREDLRYNGVELFWTVIDTHSETPSSASAMAQLALFSGGNLKRGDTEEIDIYHNRFLTCLRKIKAHNPTGQFLTDTIIRTRFLVTLGRGFEDMVHDDDRECIPEKYYLMPISDLLKNLKAQLTNYNRRHPITTVQPTAGTFFANSVITDPSTPVDSNSAGIVEAVRAGIAAAAIETRRIAEQAKADHKVKQLAAEKAKKALTAAAAAKPLFYCYTHGITANSGHTSATCKYPGPGHKCEATMKNRLGGSDRTWARPT